jgi:hypothetical protein
VSAEGTARSWHGLLAFGWPFVHLNLEIAPPFALSAVMLLNVIEPDAE